VWLCTQAWHFSVVSPHAVLWPHALSGQMAGVPAAGWLVVCAPAGVVAADGQRVVVPVAESAGLPSRAQMSCVASLVADMSDGVMLVDQGVFADVVGVAQTLVTV
jgi:hypothetical protein